MLILLAAPPDRELHQGKGGCQYIHAASQQTEYKTDDTSGQGFYEDKKNLMIATWESLEPGLKALKAEVIVSENLLPSPRKTMD